MNYLMMGGMNPEKVDLLISLTSIRSADVIPAVKEVPINGAPLEVAAAGQLTNSSNVKRALSKVNEVAAIVERCKEIDLYGKSEIITKVSAL